MSGDDRQYYYGAKSSFSPKISCRSGTGGAGGEAPCSNSTQPGEAENGTFGSGGAGLRAVILISLMVILGIKAWFWPLSPPAIPPRVPAAQAQPWMADCLPGVGPKTRDRMAEAIRAGRWEELPARARPVAEQVFMDGR